MSWSNEQTTLLIEEYSKHPCLYMVKNKDYHNKHLRSLALNKILDVIKTVKPAATELEVQKKFLGLRTTYCNERKKVLASIRSGMGEDEVYKPSLWYFSKMAFLNEHLTVRASKSSFEFVSRRVAEPVPMETLVEQQSEEFQNEDTQQIKDASFDTFEGDYEVADDGSLMSPTLENEVSRTSSRPPSSVAGPRCTLNKPASPVAEQNRSQYRSPSPVAGPSRAKRRATESARNRREDPDMAMLGEVSKQLETVAGMVQVQKTATNNNKTPERVFGEFISLQLEKIVDYDVKVEVQYQIHGILRDALRKQNNL